MRILAAFLITVLLLGAPLVAAEDPAPAPATSAAPADSGSSSSGGGGGTAPADSGSTASSGSSSSGGGTASAEPAPAAPADSSGSGSSTTTPESPSTTSPAAGEPVAPAEPSFSPVPGEPKPLPPEGGQFVQPPPGEPGGEPFVRPPPPPGCKEFTDDRGGTRVECERQQVSCPSFPEDAKNTCVADGGNPDVTTDGRGCAQFFCRFSEGNFNPVSGGRGACLPDSEQKQIAEKCNRGGGNTVWERVGGCNQPVCRYDRQEDRRPEFACRHIQQKEEEQLRESCANDGRRTIEDFDNNGCRNLRCAAPGDEQRPHGQGTNERGDYCPRELPKTMYDRCAEKGGELIIDRSPEGCVVFQECVSRGREDDIFVRQDEVQDVPDATVLLDMAFKLEELKIKFLELAKKTNGIADYYKNLGSDDEQRFRTVSSMFEAAADQVDDVRGKLRDRLQSLSRDDLVEIKYDIKSLVEVTLKDIVFYMLGGEGNAEIKAIKTAKTTTASGTKNCGTNGGCFDKAVRRCSPIQFRPEGSNGPTIFVKGVEDGACVIRVENPPGQQPPGFKDFGMTCKVEKFAKGIRGPEDMFGGDGLPFCEGPMADFLRKNPEFLPHDEPRDDFPEDQGFQRPESDQDFQRPETGGGFSEPITEDVPRAQAVRRTAPIQRGPPRQTVRDVPASPADQ